MKSDTRAKGVFLYDEPTLDKLKACSFFWKNVIVYESYLSDIVEHPDLAEVSKTLFKEDVLKICHTGESLKSALMDKIYYRLDKELWEYIYHNADKVTIDPKLPENAEQIVEESTRRDGMDPNMGPLIDKIVLMGIEEKWFNALRESRRFQFNSLTPDIKKILISEARKLIDLEYKHYLRGSTKGRHDFEFRNRYLLEQISVSTALFTPMAWLPYYEYKLGDYSIRDARKYLQGLNAIMPFVQRDSINGLSIKEILEIRKNRKWNDAMSKLVELCNEVKQGTDINQFRSEIERKVISEYQNVLGEEETSLEDLGKQLAKGSAFAGISFIPIIGNVVSTVAGFVDPIITYLQKRQAQKSLPFFLNDLRKMLG